MVRGDTPTNTFQGEAIDWQYIRLRNICRVSASDGADTIRTIIFQWFDSSTPTVGNILNTGNGVEPILLPTNGEIGKCVASCPTSAIRQFHG